MTKEHVMTDMTATEIAAAVAELTEAIKAKGHPKGFASIDYNICGFGAWIARLGRSITERSLGHTEQHTSARAALDEAKRIVDALPINDPAARSAEALRAALAAAREAGVDVGKIVGAGDAPATSIYPQGRPTNDQRRTDRTG